MKIDVLIPTIPGREEFLNRAVTSVQMQSYQAHHIHACTDLDREGAAFTRNELLAVVEDDVDYVAFLDDDDFFYPNHLDVLSTLATQHNADYVYSWFDGNDPFPENRGKVFNPQEPHHTTMTVMVRAALAKKVGFRTDHPEGWTLPQEDWRFTLDCLAEGAVFAGTSEITWHYSLHGTNTSGLGLKYFN